MPLKIGRVGQHRQAGRAARFIGAGMGGRIEISADQPLEGDAFLIFCNKAEALLRGGIKRAPEPARRRLPGGARLQIGERGGRLARRHLARLVLQISISLLVISTISSNSAARWQAPCRWLRRLPRRRPASSCASPATISAAAALKSTASR
jgi:hypothetical protein